MSVQAQPGKGRAIPSDKEAPGKGLAQGTQLHLIFPARITDIFTLIEEEEEEGSIAWSSQLGCIQ